jgi:hypothetical protein
VGDKQLYFKRALVQAGVALLGLGRAAEAGSRLEQAVAIVATPQMARVPNLDEVQADAEFALARVLWQLNRRGNFARVVALLQSAQGKYTSFGHVSRLKLETLKAWEANSAIKP